MNPTRDEILRMLMLLSMRSVDGESDIDIQNILKYNFAFELTDDLQIPYMGAVKSLIADSSGSGLISRTFLIPSADIVNGIVSLVGRTNEQGDTKIPSDPTQTIYEKGLNGKTGVFVKSNAQFDQDGEVSGLDGSFDVLVVFNGVEPVVQVGITNTTDRVINYSLNGGSFSSLNIGEFLAVNPSDTIIMQLASSSGNFYNLSNQNGDLQNTDGLYRIDENPHQWNIPSDTTSLQIIYPL